MRTALTVLVCLLPCGCFDPSAPADTESGTTDPETSGSAGVTGTATQATSATATTNGPTSTTATSGSSSSTSSTGEATGSSTGPGETETGGSGDGSSTGSDVGCGDGLFKGDWPDLGAAEVIDGNRNYQGIKVVDINGDDNLDLIVADFSNTIETSGVYFYEGDGGGNFEVPTLLPGPDSYALVVDAAAISDSTVDVIATMLDEDSVFTVRRWRGNGDGTFLAPVDFAGATSFALALADTNGDERLDLLGVGDDGLRVRLGNAQEGFGAQNAYGGTGATDNVEWADLNGDEDVDVITADGDAIWVMLGDGTGVFPAATQYPVDGGVTRVLVGDFDGDGNVDLGSARGALVTVFPGDGSGDFGASSELTVQGDVVDATATDFDADGCSDIAVLNNSGSVSTILGRDRFGFTDQHVFTFDAGDGFPYAMDSGDIDGDGIADVLVVTAIGSLQGEILSLRSGA